MGRTRHQNRAITTTGGWSLSRSLSARPLSRGSGDVALYMVRTRDRDEALVDDQDLPRLEDTTTTKEAVSAKLLVGGKELLASEVDPGADEVAQLMASKTVDELAQRSQAGEALATRALSARMEAVATRAQLHPDPRLLARLGERPAGGAERSVWDSAVASVAQYQERWPSEVAGEEGEGGAWALGRPPDGPGTALDAYALAAERLVVAEVQHLAARPTALLAGERRQLVSALGPHANDRDQRSRLEGEEEMAMRRLEEARSALDDAEQARERAGRPRRRGRGDQALERARRAVASAHQHVGAAARNVEEARERLSAFASSAGGRRPARQRLANVKAALDHQVDAALRRDQPYLRATLGERPANPTEAARWERAARIIERHRHYLLGLGPDDGALGDTGLAASVGAVPNDQVARQYWMRLQKDVAQTMGPPELGLSR